MVPPAGKVGTKMKGLGALGMAGLYGVEGLRTMFGKKLPEE
jgi:hypothetical protein